MKILFLIHQFYPTCQYGAETYAYHLGQGLQKAGHQITVFHRENHVPRAFKLGQILQEEELEVDGLAVHRVFLSPAYVEGRGLFFNFLSTFYNPPIEKAFAHYLDQVKPDIIHLHHLLFLSGGLVKIARERNIPIVATLHDFWYFCMNAQLLRPNHAVCIDNPLKWHCGSCMAMQYRPKTPAWLIKPTFPLFQWRDNYLRQAISQVNVLLAPAQFLLRRHVEMGFPAEKLRFLEYGINLTELGAVERQDNPALPLRFGYIGSLTQHKGVHILIEAFKQLPIGQGTLDIYGSPHAFPDYAARLKALANDHPNIHFHGGFDHAKIGEVLAGLDMIVVPSVWYENSPVIIREAIAAQVPVITSNLGSLPEKVRHGVDGLLFAPGDKNDLCAQLQRVINNPTEILAFRRNLPLPSDINTHLTQVLQIYQEFIKP